MLESETLVIVSGLTNAGPEVRSGEGQGVAIGLAGVVGGDGQSLRIDGQAAIGVADVVVAETRADCITCHDGIG